MPYHPAHLRPHAWQIILIATVVGLLVGTFIWSFRAGRQQHGLDASTRGTRTAPAVREPAVPEAPGRPVP